MRISYSALDLFERCPLQYKFKYLDHLKTPERPEFYFGSLMHKVVQEALKKDPITVSLDDLNKFFQENWREEPFPDKDTAEKYKRWGETMIRNFHAAHKPGLTNIVTTEKMFQVPLGKKHQLIGFIDRVDKLPYGPYEIIDYKTSAKMASQPDLDRNKQLTIYHYATQKLWPDAKDVKLTLYFLKFGVKISTKRIDADVTQIIGDVEKAADKIEKAVANKKEADFPATPNPLCGWCDFGEKCPMMKAKYSEQRGASSKQAKEMIEEYIKSHQKIHDLEPRIHEHFDEKEIERFFTKYGTITRSPKTKRLTIKKID